jgi:hypothetical protein
MSLNDQIRQEAEQTIKEMYQLMISLPGIMSKECLAGLITEGSHSF